jgi:hypothetical protein
MPGGLLSVARRLPAGSDWRGGITFTPQCGTTSGRWSCTTAGEKDVSDKPDPQRFDPFLIHSGARCSGAPVMDDLQELVRGELTRASSGWMAEELVLSDPDVGNLDLSTAATDITPLDGLDPAPTSLKNSIAGLLSAASECGAGEVMLHVPIVTLVYLIDLGLEWRDGHYWLGAIPVSVDKYPPLGGVAIDDSEAWLYLTRPVEFEITPIGEIEFNHFTGRLNEAVLVGERLAVLRFDPCCVYAIRAVVCG